MNLNTKHLKAILKIPHLKEELIDEKITEQDFLNFEILAEEKKKLIFDQVVYIMKNGSAEHIATYGNPVAAYIDPFVIYGEKGIYLVVEADWGSFTFSQTKKMLSSIPIMLLMNGLNKVILSFRGNMKYILMALKYIGYAILSILLALQVISFVSSPDFIRGFILLVAGMYFANKWQKKNRPQEEIFIDEKKANAD